MKKQLLLLAMILLPLVASAYDAYIDGIYYNLVSKAKIAEVTSNPNNFYYSGEVVIPESVTYEGENYSVTSIGDWAFGYCSGLTSVTIPNNVTSIGACAFYNCSGLTSVSIPNNVKSIGGRAFYECRGLTTVTISNNVKKVENGAFEGCYKLTSVHISSLEAWCKISFGTNDANPLYHAHHLYLNGEEIKDLVIPNSVTSIESNAFYGCSGLSSLTIPSSVTSIGGDSFSGCSGLTLVTIPSSVTSIGSWAFIGCSGLTSITIPNSVTSIGVEAFKNCSKIKTITLGSGIGKISNGTFSYCPELTDFYCYANKVPNTYNDVFKGSYIEGATLHVPEAYINNYRATEPWKNFKEIISIESGDNPESPKCEKPTISYEKGQLKFASVTEGAKCVTTISDADVKTHYGNAISLTATYNISVYATKAGYDNSETATATLCWIDKEPTTEGITDGVAQISSKAVLIQSEGGILKVEGIDDGTQVAVYTPDGKQGGSAVCRNGAALVGTSIQPGNTAIVKIGEKSVKVIVK